MHIAGERDVVDALRKIAAAKAAFVSRGDHSGTHEAELRLWKQAGIDVRAAKDGWYCEIGQGMGVKKRPRVTLAPPDGSIA
jgi:tungstate transport system substrate-binding protein